MIIEKSLKIINYKCFDSDEQGFEKICPINIIVGKNNSGKSSLIDLIEYVIDPSKDIIQSASSNSRCIVGVTISEEMIKEVANHYSSGNNSAPGTWDNPLTTHFSTYIKNKQVKFSFQGGNNLTFISDTNEYGQYHNSFVATFVSEFNNRKFKRLTAERDINPEQFYIKEELAKNGKGATIIIWKYLTIKGFDQNLIKKEFLINLNKITIPDIEFVDITVKEDIPDNHNRQTSTAEIYFENKSGVWIPLSKMGSGVKTIILVLLNLIVIPKQDNIPKKNLVFGLEELENNLHPSLQRRLFNYISEYAEINKCYFFITTHSSIPIDLFSQNKNAQIIHVENKGLHSVTKTVNSNIDGRNVLKDLEYKASDILLSNGVVWVEGPSDTIYIELLLDLYKNSINANIDKLSYTIQTLATAIWKYAGFADFDWHEVDDKLENRIISLASINHNHLIVIDRDGNYDDKKPSDHDAFKNGIGRNKARLIYESMAFGNHNENRLENNFGDTKDGKLFFWINDGTFETYMEYFLSNKGKEFEKYFDSNKTRGYFEKKREGENSSKSKVELAAEIAKFALSNNFIFEDFAPPGSALANKILRLFETIKSWN